MNFIKISTTILFLFSLKTWALDCPNEDFIAITIQISTGENGSETAWQLTDTDTNELLAEASWFDNNSTENTTVCVPLHSNLNFTIACCINNQGGFEIIMQDQTILSGSNYQDNESYYFTATPTASLDAELQSLELSPYILTKPHFLSGKIKNIGFENINNILLNWQVNDGQIHETAISNINLLSFETYTFELEEAFYPTNEGIQQLKIWINSINQSTDNNQNNDTISFQTNSFYSFSKKITLVENFTNASCSSCATIDSELIGLLQSNISQIAPISYHTPFPSFDVFYFDNSTDVDARLQAYEIAGVPAVYLSGNAVSGFFPVPTINQLQSLHSVPSLISLTLKEKINANNIDTTIHFNLEIMPHTDINNENLELHLVLIEKEIEADNIGSNGVSHHFYTMRKMLPNAQGTVLPSMSKNEVYTYNFTHKIANYLNFNELRSIVFIQDRNTKAVYQALLSNETTGYNQQSNWQYIGANFGQLDVLKQSPSCDMSENGSITLVAAGKFPPFSFLWEDGATTAFRSNLSAGNYFVTVSDFNETGQAFAIEISPSPSFEIEVQTMASNLNQQNGMAFVTLVNAQEPLLYEWSNGEISPNINNLAAGDYTVSVTDAYGCMQSSSFTIGTISTSTNNINATMTRKPLFFPNPTKNIVYLSTNQAIEVAPQVQVYDCLGGLQASLKGEKTFDKHQFSYDISQLKNGYYFFNLKYEKEMFIYKMLIIN